MSETSDTVMSERIAELNALRAKANKLTEENSKLAEGNAKLFEELKRMKTVTGDRYTIRFMNNGTCDFAFDRRTNSIFRALWYLITLSLKYPIVDFEIRRGYIIPCEKCTADWCGKSPAFGAETEGAE